MQFGCKVTKSRAQNKETPFFFCRDGVSSRSNERKDTKRKWIVPQTTHSFSVKYP